MTHRSNSPKARARPEAIEVRLARLVENAILEVARRVEDIGVRAPDLFELVSPYNSLIRAVAKPTFGLRIMTKSDQRT